MKVQSPYTKIIIDYKKAKILEKFPELEKLQSDNFISIYKYISHIPECFYNEKVFNLFSDWLISTDFSNQGLLKSYFSDNEKRISNAIRNLNQINELNIHDEDIQGKDDYNLLEVIDNCIHPNYLRLVEGVFAPLIHPIGYISRLLRNAGVEKLDVYNLVEEIQSKYSGFQVITRPYNHIIRNSIAHGSVDYLNHEIQYTDKNGTETLFYADVITLFDDLIDCCNAIVFALKVFLLNHNKDGYRFPCSFLIEELKAQTENKWLEVNNCLPMTIQGNKSQLLIYTYVKTTDVLKVELLMFQIANIAETLLPDYERYFITFRSNCSYPGWFSFDGSKLAFARMSKTDNYKVFIDAIDESGMFLKTKLKFPKLIYKIDNFIESFSVCSRKFKDDIQKIFKSNKIEIKTSEMHRNGCFDVLNANIELCIQDELNTMAYIKNQYKAIVRSVFKQAKLIGKHDCILKILSLGFARISVYSKHMRKRAYKHYGLEKDLVCVIQYKKLQRIRCPSIFESSVEEHGLYRIEWNKKWLEKNEV